MYRDGLCTEFQIVIAALTEKDRFLFLSSDSVLGTTVNAETISLYYLTALPLKGPAYTSYTYNAAR